MNKRTLDETIKHCEEVAERYERMEDSSDDKLKEECLQCATDHRQLAGWLTELKDLREKNKVLTSECDRLIKEKGELLKKSEQIAECKRLLKAAAEDYPDLTDMWRYADEALKLIGDEK